MADEFAGLSGVVDTEALGLLCAWLRRAREGQVGAFEVVVDGDAVVVRRDDEDEQRVPLRLFEQVSIGLLFVALYDSFKKLGVLQEMKFDPAAQWWTVKLGPEPKITPRELYQQLCRALLAANV